MTEAARTALFLFSGRNAVFPRLHIGAVLDDGINDFLGKRKSRGKKEQTEYIKGIFNNEYTEITLEDGRRVGYKTYQRFLQVLVQLPLRQQA